MPEIKSNLEASEIKMERSEVNDFKNIKPEEGMTFHEAQAFWDDFFEKEMNQEILKSVESNSEKDNSNEVSEINKPIQNKIDGLVREKEVSEELEKKYPLEEGYEIASEAYLRDADGKIVRDSETGEARRIDFVVIKNEKVIDSIEVTSKTADKTVQSAKEARIRDAGGNYVRDDKGNLVKIPFLVQTRIERRD